METKKKILIFLAITLILGTITFLIIRNMENSETDNENSTTETQTTDAVIESITYDQYLEYRSEAHETESYAILIWDSSEEVSLNYLEELKVAFKSRTTVVYTLDTSELSDSELSRVIDDMTEVLEYDTPTLMVPTLLVMNKGTIVYIHEGFLFHEELMEQLNSKSIE